MYQDHWVAQQLKSIFQGDGVYFFYLENRKQNIIFIHENKIKNAKKQIKLYFLNNAMINFMSTFREGETAPDTDFYHR